MPRFALSRLLKGSLARTFANDSVWLPFFFPQELTKKMWNKLVIVPLIKQTKASGVVVNIPISIPTFSASCWITKLVLVPNRVSIPPS